MQTMPKRKPDFDDFVRDMDKEDLSKLRKAINHRMQELRRGDQIVERVDDSRCQVVESDCIKPDETFEVFTMEERRRDGFGDVTVQPSETEKRQYGEVAWGSEPMFNKSCHAAKGFEGYYHMRQLKDNNTLMHIPNHYVFVQLRSGNLLGMCKAKVLVEDGSVFVMLQKQYCFPIVGTQEHRLPLKHAINWRSIVYICFVGEPELDHVKDSSQLFHL